ncbi:MAG: metallophosphoesterase [Polyangiales bacterium]
MQILHISDLHITTPGETLDTVWNGPAAVLAERQFDFIVVSGDLSQRAAEREYGELIDFARNALLKLLKKKERERVIFVPGNHDVSWEARIGDAIPFEEYVRRRPGADPARLLAALQRAPERAGARHVIRPDGRVEVIEVSPELYPERFLQVQGFLGRFYEHSLKGAHRMMDLTAPDDGEHWSAHVFPEQGVAFYGFSSCHRNDRYWHGATISRLALNRAAEHAREYAKNLLLVAVWHHGLTGEPGRPDHLTLLDVGELYNAGFRIGFHGHTHEAAGEILDKFFGDRFVVVSTGSVGAGSEERPDAVGRQFSVVQLHPGQASVQVWERRNVGVFRPSGPARFYLLPHAAARPVPLSRAGLHRRHIFIHENGIAEVRVELRDLRAEGRTTLAIVHPQHGNVKAERTAMTRRGVWPVIREERPDGRIHFTLASNDVEAEEVSWSYRISNAHAIHRAELRLMRRDVHWMPDALGEQDECRGHEIHFPTDRFEMAVEYAPGLPGLDPDTVKGVVDRRRNDGGNEWWERVRDEESERRWQVVRRDARRVDLAVDAPLVGHRYTAVYRLGERSDFRLDEEALLVARTVVERARRERPGAAQGFCAQLSRALVEGLVEVFGDGSAAGLTMVGSLWHPEEKLLLTAFGRLNHSHWGARFPAGAGIAGHAFRFAQTATWHRRSSQETSLIYRESSEARSIYGTEYPHQWIVAVPILTRHKAAIGVVSFGSRESQSNAEFALATYAESAARGEVASQFEVNLRFAVNYSFWETLANPAVPGEDVAPQGEGLPAMLRAYAAETARALDREIGSTPPELPRA